MSWTPELVDLLKKLWGSGLSAAKISEEISNKFSTRISRNAVIGCSVIESYQFILLVLPKSITVYSCNKPFFLAFLLGVSQSHEDQFS